MIEKAIAVALDAHRSQVDLAGYPYILHPLRLAAKHEDSELLYTVAILHDVVEDTFGKPNMITLDELFAEFGLNVTASVDALTRREAGMRLWYPFRESEVVYQKHEEDYLNEYIPRCAKDPAARIIKRDDLIDHFAIERMKVMEDKDLARLSRYHQALKIL